MQILIIEDEAKTVDFLSKGLTENGYSVETARDGDTGLRMARAGQHDLILLDIMLPGRDGWAVIEELRRHGQKTPVLCLTARDAVSDRVRGLELGADDYLVKPFAFSELLARVRSLGRRGQGRTQEVMKVSDLEVDLIRQRVTRGTDTIDLAPKEFALLSLFIRNEGQALSRARIAEEVWDMKYEGETNVVDVAVRRLRAKMDDPYTKKLIHTVRGVGYVLADR
jgi:two-component system, OmpR family, copper resistance phosphate regulon response regulator CusR